MNPRDTYTQNGFGNQATFQLLPDKLLIRGSTFPQYRYEFSIPLSSLNPEFGRVWARDQQCWMGVFLVVLFSIVSAAAYAISANEKALHTNLWHLPSACFYFTIPAILFGIWMTYRTISLVESAVFYSSAGAFAFSVSCRGDHRAYEDFITSVVEAIKTTHNRTHNEHGMIDPEAEQGGAGQPPTRSELRD